MSRWTAGAREGGWEVTPRGEGTGALRTTEVERQRWVTALELAKAKAVKMLAESGGASPW